MKIIISHLFLIFLCLFSTSLVAHEPNHSYILVRNYEKSYESAFLINILDLNKGLGLDISSDIGVGDLEKIYADTIQRFYLKYVSFSTRGKKMPLQFTGIEIQDLGERIFVLSRFRFTGIVTLPEKIDVRYEVLFDEVPYHKGGLYVDYDWKAGIVKTPVPYAHFEKGKTEDTAIFDEGSYLRGFLSLIKEGIWHIWIGIDHILFLVALLLPAVIVRSSEYEFSIVNLGRKFRTNDGTLWSPVAEFKPAIFVVLKIVTFFTISHSVTLGLSALDIVVLPSRVIESIIAISIAIAAFHNIRPLYKGKEWVIVFVFGLFHGFGFANVLNAMKSGEFETEHAVEYLGSTLLGFNIGVEVGQIAIIATLFPVLFLLRKSKFYSYILIFGSILLIFISMYWFVERVFEIEIPLKQFIKNLI